MSDGKTLLTIAETAELLNCSSGFVRKRIALTEGGQPGGWPKSTYVNLQPNGAKSLFRVKKGALEEFLASEPEPIVEAEAPVAAAPSAAAATISDAIPAPTPTVCSV